MFEGTILRTPLIPYDHQIYMKPENLQVFGSYKIRGVASAIKASDKERLRHGLLAISAGNMAQAVAYAARELKLPCKIFIPDSAPPVKKAAIKKLDAEIVELPFEEIWTMVREGNPNDHQGLLIHPVFTTGILEGYGGIAREIIEDLPDVDAIVIPFGVGGLTLGMTKVIRSLKPGISIYACEPSSASPLHVSLKMGRAMKVERLPSFIDAIGTPELLEFVYHELKDLIDGSISITPEEAMNALKILLSKSKLLGEGAAGVALAAAIKISKDKKHKKIACVLSGGNISPELIIGEEGRKLY